MNVRERNFPDFIQAYLDYTRGHEATERCHLWSIVAVIAAALERRVWMDRGFYTLYPNLYVFIVGKSGLIKKSTTTGIAVDLLRELPGIRMMSERLTASSLISQLDKAGVTFPFEGRKVNQSALFVYASELSVFLQEVYGSILELLTTFYDCVPQDSSKPWVYDTKGGGRMQIYGPCLNILAATTQPWLKKCLPTSEMEGGFTSRVLFVVENNPPDRLVAWPEVNQDLRDHRRLLVQDLQKIFCLVGRMHVTQGAKELFTNWYQHHMKTVVPCETDPRFAGYNGRKGDLLLKLAIVRSVSLRSTLELQAVDLEWAGEQLEILEPDMRQAFSRSVLSRSGQIGYDLLQYIQRKGVAEKIEMRRHFAREASQVEIDQSLQDLLEMGEIEISEEIIDGLRATVFRPKTYNTVEN